MFTATVSQASCSGLRVTRSKQYITSIQIQNLGCGYGANNGHTTISFEGEENLRIKLSFVLINAEHMQGNNQSSSPGYVVYPHSQNASIPLVGHQTEGDIVIAIHTADVVLTDSDNIMLIGFQGRSDSVRSNEYLPT